LFFSNNGDQGREEEKVTNQMKGRQNENTSSALETGYREGEEVLKDDPVGDMKESGFVGDQITQLDVEGEEMELDGILTMTATLGQNPINQQSFFLSNPLLDL
jgi:hypothetical protein